MRRRTGRIHLLCVVAACVGSAAICFAQEQRAPPGPPAQPQDAAISVTWSYSRSASGCDGFGSCTDDKVSERFSAGASLHPVDGGFEGNGSGSYQYDSDAITHPTMGCPGGASSSLDYSGSADFVVHAQCSIDNDITGGPDTSQYGPETSVVEVLLEDYDLHTDSETHDCDGNSETWSDETGSVGFGCFFYGVNFDAPGTYTYRPEVTEDSYGTCTLNFDPGTPKDLRIYGTVMGQGGSRAGRTGPVPISNARVVALKSDQPRLKKLSESKPAFNKMVATSDDKKAEYEIWLSLCDEPPRVVVVSLLWYDGKPPFAVTNGPEPVAGKPGIPIYLAACVDSDPKSQCYKWKKAANGYEAEVNFEYGDDDQIDRQAIFMDSEAWEGYSSQRNLMKESAYIYYDAYRSVKYFDHLALGYSKDAVMIRSHYLDEICPPKYLGAWYENRTAQAAPIVFGDLGRYLEPVDARGAIFICAAASPIDYPDAPVNEVWHELAHYLLYRMYSPRKSCPAGRTCKNHWGFKNGNSSDSFVEGFAEFTAALTNRFYGSAAPYLYPVADSTENLELDFKAWTVIEQPPDDPYAEEEWAVAGVLWDLLDPGKEIALQHSVNGVLLDLSRVYPAPVDEVSLDEKLILQVIQKGKPQTVVDLYNAYAGTYVSRVDLDMIFLEHGFFADTVERNFIQDSAAEIIPQSGNSPDRLDRESPAPTLRGSYILSDAGGTFDVAVTLSQDGAEQYHYSYTLQLEPGVPAYFTMPPEYYPSTAAFSPLLDGKKGPAVLEISSDEYWQYIRSGPEQSAIFKRIASGKSD